MTSAVILGLALLLASACGDDDDDGGGTDGGMTAVDAGGGVDAGGATAEAIAFCGDYDTTCGYDPADAAYYDDEAACTGYYDGADAACQTCITTHLGLAGEDAATHCPHAMGMGPCAGDCS